MRKRGYLLLCGLVLSLAAAPALTQADWGEGGPGRHHGGPGGFGEHGGPGRHMMGGGPGMALHLILRKLNLTPAQQQAVDQIMASHRSNFHSLFEQMHGLRKKVDAKFFSDTPPSVTDPDVEALESLRGKLASEGFASALEIRAFLVKENLWPQAVQIWQKMESMREEMRSFFEEKK